MAALYKVSLIACREEVDYPAVHPAEGTYLAVHLAGQRVTEAEAEAVNRMLASNGHPVVLLDDTAAARRA